jgi:hypothetical protein
MTGNCVLPSKKKDRTFSKGVWGFAFNEVITSVEHLTDKQWGKIQDGASEYIGAHKSVPSVAASHAKMGMVSGRAACIEVDSDSDE